MIELSNGHVLEYAVSSGSLAFDGRGWPWEKPLVRAGLIRPELFTVVLKTLTRRPRAGNLRWHKPWSCVRLLPGGSVNKVGLTNPGVDWWCRDVAPGLDYRRQPLVASIFGDPGELAEMTAMMNRFDLVGIEVNPSCPNTGHALETAEAVIRGVAAVKAVSRHPVIVKVSASQDYCAIARGLVGVAEALTLNSIPWELAFPGARTPLWRLEQRVGGGGGGVSGRPAQHLNWRAVRDIAAEGTLPVIAPSIMDFSDLERVRALGARAVSFGAIHLRTPWKPTSIVLRDKHMGVPALAAERRAA
jgi:dihydroorotate dehydrogenase